MTSEHKSSKLPVASAIALLCPLGATFYAWKLSSGNVTVSLGYGLSSLGYLLFAAGIFSGSFTILRLKRRLHVFVAAALLWALGFVLCNLGL